VSEDGISALASAFFASGAVASGAAASGAAASVAASSRAFSGDSVFCVSSVMSCSNASLAYFQLPPAVVVLSQVECDRQTDLIETGTGAKVAALIFVQNLRLRAQQNGLFHEKADDLRRCAVLRGMRERR
jgi:hypothetical protein